MYFWALFLNAAFYLFTFYYYKDIYMYNFH